VNADEEDIAFSRDFQLDDFDFKPQATFQAGPKYENKTLWSYTSAVKTD
jgi:hypothetical protein